MFGVFKDDDNDDVRLVGKWVWVAIQKAWDQREVEYLKSGNEMIL